MSFTLRDYQKQAVEALPGLLSKYRKVVGVAGTGAGKTVIMTRFISDNLHKMKGRVIVFVDAEELVHQTSEAFYKQGIEHQLITANSGRVYRNQKVYISMVKTFLSRVKNFPDFLPTPSICIIDECHIKTYNKVMDVFPEAYYFGLTATPVYMGKKESMSDYYEKCFIIRDTPDLIDSGNLNPEKAYVTQLGRDDLEKLKRSSTGDFTGSSLDLVFNSDRILNLVFEQWGEKCRGIKTIIYASSILHAQALTALFKAKGINTRSQDSKNNTNADRKKTVEWFKEETGEAVLINVATFVKGFDVPDVKAIILAFSTLSLSKFVQIAGRGSRLAPGKSEFLLIDLGNNILKASGEPNHGLWSDARDWEALFNGKRSSQLEGAAPMRQCSECGFISPMQAKACGECGTPFPVRDREKEMPKEIKVIEYKGKGRGKRKVEFKSKKPVWLRQ